MSAERLERALLVSGDRILASVIAVIVALTAAQVAGRYLFGASLPWVQETVRLLFVWAVMIGTAVACGRASHIAFDGFVERTGPVWARRIRVVMSAASIAFLTVVAITGWQLVLRNIGQHSAVLGVPMSLAYAAIPVGAGLGALAMASAMRRMLQG